MVTLRHPNGFGSSPKAVNCSAGLGALHPRLPVVPPVSNKKRTKEDQTKFVEQSSLAKGVKFQAPRSVFGG